MASKRLDMQSNPLLFMLPVLLLLILFIVFQNDISNFLKPFLKDFVPSDPPGSSFFIVIIALVISVISTLLSRSMIDIERLKSLTRQTKEFNALKMRALREGDKRLLAKVEKSSSKMSQMQSELMSMRMKPMLYLMPVTITIFIVLNNFYTTDIGSEGAAIAAYIPYSLPENLIILPVGRDYTNDPSRNVFVTTFFFWYFAINITFGAIIQKLAGLNPD